MANEITVVGANGRDVQLLMLFPVAVPAVDSDDQAVVPTPSTGLPAVAAAKLDQTEKDALDDGSMVFKVYKMGCPAGMSAAALLAQAQANYAIAATAIAAEYGDRYQFLPRVGQRFNAA